MKLDKQMWLTTKYLETFERLSWYFKIIRRTLGFTRLPEAAVFNDTGLDDGQGMNEPFWDNLYGPAVFDNCKGFDRVFF